MNPRLAFQGSCGFLGRSTVTVSIVSHAHGQMVMGLVNSLLDCPEVAQIIVIQNIPEFAEMPKLPGVRVIENSSPRGFAANQNAAFRACVTSYIS